MDRERLMESVWFLIVMKKGVWQESGFKLRGGVFITGVGMYVCKFWGKQVWYSDIGSCAAKGAVQR